VPLECVHLGPGDEGHSGLDALFGVEKQWKYKSCIAEIMVQNSAVLSQPLATEKKVFWSL
jgi:hypothetical protein